MGADSQPLPEGFSGRRDGAELHKSPTLGEGGILTTSGDSYA
jgi:hypothetical protein